MSTTTCTFDYDPLLTSNRISFVVSLIRLGKYLLKDCNQYPLLCLDTSIRDLVDLRILTLSENKILIEQSTL